MGKGKHHIGDFLPPEELDKFIETVSAVKEDRNPGEMTCVLATLISVCTNLIFLHFR